MLLYIVRHAWAADYGPSGDDRQRALTAEGRRRFADVVAWFVKRDFAPKAIVTSPLVRCVQTAELLAEGSPARPKVFEREELAPGSDLRGLLKWMGQQDWTHDEICWVGHAPDVGRLTALLIGGGRAAVDFPKAAMAALRFDERPAEGAGELRWLVTPRLLGK